MSPIKETIAKNLTNLRNKKGYTQAELAEMLNYTDKSVSKWENGDVTPPIDVLKALADIYDVSLDYLVEEFPPENFDKRYQSKQNNLNKIFITSLAVVFVWLVATVLFVYNSFIGLDKPWLLFVIAVPVSFLFLLVFNFIWGRKKFTPIISSLLLWSFLATIYLNFIEYTPWTIFLIGIPLQIATILWSQLKSSKNRK
ncbi:MAG: helix-turn-helix transcriptional regulator [Clostridia bacterium]|nr:helix-turn-helix transcriptional regulator [Clostridia bacterium]